MKTYLRHFVAEFVGIFALVFVGGGAIMMASLTNSTAGLVTVGLAHGIILAVMVSATMNVSGGHLNPAVTLAMLVTRRIAPIMAAVHVGAQLVGAALAALALKWTVPEGVFSATRGGGQSISLDITMPQAIGLEVIATFFLVFVIFGTAVSAIAPRLGGMAIGLTIAADIMAIGPLTGASMNPARSFGPAFATSIYEAQAVYWIGPIIGAIIAGLVWEFVLLDKTPPST
jgi:MIP family channel proteins